MKERINYERALNKSVNQKRIKISSKNYILDKQKFKEFKKNVVIFTSAVALTVMLLGVVKDEIKFHNEKLNIMFSVSSQMADSGYGTVPINGNWSYRYDLIDDIEPFNLLLYMGEESTLNVLRHRGYDSWNDYVNKEGYENINSWYKGQKEMVLEQTKVRGVKK